MYTYRYVPLSIILMMSVSVLQASSLVPATNTRFKTEADIHLGVKLAALGAGFTAGVAEQTAAFAYFVSSMDKAKHPILPCVLYGDHWIFTFKFAFDMMASSHKKLEELQSSERSFLPVMTKMGYHLNSFTPGKMQEIRDDYKRLYNGGQGICPLNAVRVRSAYNDLLQRQVISVHFWGGVLATAVVGPIGGVWGTVALHKIGILDLD